MKAHARRDDPETSFRAAKLIEVTPSQRAVLKVFRICNKDILDEELIANYKRYRSQFKLPRQSESGIRSRRAELTRMDKLIEVGKARMTTGGTGRLWRIKDEP